MKTLDDTNPKIKTLAGRFIPREITFATAILIGLGLFSAVLAAGFTVGYWVKANETVQVAGRQLFFQRQNAIAARLESLFDGPQFFALNMAQSPTLMEGDVRDIEESLLSTLEHYSWIVNLKIGFANKFYFSVSRIADIPDTRYYTPPAGAKYAIVTVTPNDDGTYTQTVKFRDRDMALFNETSVSASTTDVTNLDWYQIGRDNGGALTWIGRVIPGGVGARISFVIGFYGRQSGSIGVDIGERDVTEILDQVSDGADEHLIVFGDDGIRYGSNEPDSGTGGAEPGKTAKPKPNSRALDDAIVSAFEENGPFSGKTLSIEGRAYFATVIPIEFREATSVVLYAGIAAPLDRLEGPLRENLFSVLVLIAATLIVAVPLVVVVARKVSEPLRVLRNLADETLRLNFSSSTSLRSAILEVRELANSFRRAQTAFQNICRFVPEAHVKRTITSEEAVVFGERRKASLLMTDVTNFTTMAEQIEPELLLQDMSEYFDVMNTEILREGGTIDKYVGDAIFSYWNGVVDQPEHAEQCCRAALRVRDASRKLVEDWKQTGKHPWATRISLHCGDVIVGNIGSAKRMDFTVIGNSVNLASRIEGLNKNYGTEILASEAIKSL
ncbi:MAG: adenylate/guanylate cyclase domain-containing protein [Rhodobacteraceae bacterium]|nr:adenylate/guanylate cyclase domain-containing protein [Paracoccaceae bacterium]